MVWSSTCIVMSSSPRIAPCLLMLTSSGACAAKTLCWPAVITAKKIFVKKYRTVVIIISKSRFGSISIDRISTGSSFGTFCSLRSKLNSDDQNTLQVYYMRFMLVSHWCASLGPLNVVPPPATCQELTGVPLWHLGLVGYFKNSFLFDRNCQMHRK